jgi:hypothetical protein
MSNTAPTTPSNRAADVPPLRLATALQSTFARYLQMAGDASAVTAQQDLTLSLVPTLAQDQALARAHARDWVVGDAPQVLTAITAVSGYARVLQAFTPVLQAGADAVDHGGDPAALSGYLSALRLQVGQRISELTATTTAFGPFRQSVQDDTTRFTQLGQQVPATYGPDLVRLQTQLGALLDRMAADNATITGAAAALLPGLAVLGLAAGVATIDVAQAKVILQKGYEMTKGVVDAADQAMADSAAAIGEYRTAVTALAEEQAQLAVFATVAGNVRRLGSSTDQALGALHDLSTGWSDEDGYLLWLSTLARGSTPTGVRAAVDAMTERWSAIATSASALLAAAVQLTLAD